MISTEEMDMLIGFLMDNHGYDFSNYTKASLKRRIERIQMMFRFPSFAELYYKLKSEPGFAQHVIEQLTVNVTEMFRDPYVFKLIREKVVPILSTYPLIRIWHAGCSTGEEVYSMAILLEEANLLHKSLLYATDLNRTVLDNLSKGIFPISAMKQNSENYNLSGGKRNFSDYYTANYGNAKFHERLKSRMIVASHNLVSDRSFNEFQLIFCRNVLIYFDKVLQDKVLTLMDASLEKLGFIVLGSKENIRFSAIAANYMQLENKEKIWRKMK